jgi:general secretion pathway protein A
MPQTIFHFFGLRENPFKINPDPRFLFVTDQARATGDELAYAIRTRKGLILLTGEVGTGKTMLIRRLLDWLAEQKMPTALIFNSHIKPDHLLDFILHDFGVPCTSTIKSEKLIALNSWLLERYRSGQTPVLIVDEAQGLEPTALEEIRLLLNFETPREKLLQIVLAGQPELEIKLKRHELRQLRQRITVRCRTAPLALEQTYGYIRERLRVAGADGNPIFEPDAVRSVHAYSGGIPRVINVLCEQSLINACADDANTISASAVDRAARDCQLDRADSIARILNTGSYSTTNVSDIGSIFAAASASSDSPTEPREPQSEPSPAACQDRYEHVQPWPAAEQVHAAAVVKNPPKENAIPPEALAPPAAQYVQETFPPSQALPRPTESNVARMPLSPSRRSPTDFLRLWGRSFASDARATSRQIRRALHSLEIRWWNPLARELLHELHQARVRSSRLLCDPRWKHLRTRAVSTSVAAWQACKSATPPWLSGSPQQEPPQRVHGAAPSPANRRRAITSLRRWLHQPFINQRKADQRNQHR